MTPSWRRKALLALVASCCVACSHSHTAYRAASAPGFRASYPSSWARIPHPPPSPGLRLLTQGPVSHPGCPKPLLLVRQEGAPNGTLDQAVLLYNRLEQLRRPARKVSSQRPVRIRGTQAAVLIVGEYPTEPDGATVKSFDLLGRTNTGGALHLFASGCAADLPDQFLRQAVMSLEAR